MSQTQPPEMEDGAEGSRRSRSNTTASNVNIRPKSRGSTASVQSVGVGTAFQPSQQIPMEHGSVYHVQPPPTTHIGHGFHTAEQYAQYQHHMAQMHPQPIQPAMPQQDIRPMSQHGFQEVQPYSAHYGNGMSQYPPHQHMQHVRHASEQYEGSPAPEDSDTGAARRKKGNATSMANDQELRRLLQQYSGKTLQEVANEVQKNEGSGGKAEKAKQVFAMLWYVLLSAWFLTTN